jgi:hypothetical protein
MGLPLDAADVGQAPFWPGLSGELMAEIRDVCLSPAGTETRKLVSQRFTVSYQRPLLFAMPLAVAPEMTARLRAFTAALCRMVTTVARTYFEDEEIRRVVPLPPGLPDSAADPVLRSRQRFEVDLCRLDLYPTHDGGFQVLEVNANCPGGVINAGATAAAWRQALPRISGRLELMGFEEPGWMARRLLKVLPEPGGPGACVPVFCESTGWQHETREIAQTFRDLGYVSFVADPGEVTHVENSGVLVRGQVARAGYQKISIQQLLAAQQRAPGYFQALAGGDLAVQNGYLSRFITDSKLCLAVFSQERFRDRFPAADWDLIAPHIPWSRNFARCGEQDRERILRDPDGYVLKHPLDTRGAGVVVGRDRASAQDWRRAAGRALREGWLVQEHVSPASVVRWPDDPARYRHDISVFASSGIVTGGFARSGAAWRVNVPAGGETHPLLFASQHTPAHARTARDATA